MSKYTVIAKMYTTLVCEIEAENEFQAWQLAKEKDGGEFTALPDGDWEIYDVQEVSC